jgi:hypothetical protein
MQDLHGAAREDAAFRSITPRVAGIYLQSRLTPLRWSGAASGCFHRMGWGPAGSLGGLLHQQTHLPHRGTDGSPDLPLEGSVRPDGLARRLSLLRKRRSDPTIILLKTPISPSVRSPAGELRMCTCAERGHDPRSRTGISNPSSSSTESCKPSVPQRWRGCLDITACRRKFSVLVPRPAYRGAPAPSGRLIARRLTLVHLWVHPSEEDGQEAGGTSGSADIERRVRVGVSRLFLAVLEKRSLAGIRAEDLIAHRFLWFLRGNRTGEMIWFFGRAHRNPEMIAPRCW